MSGCVKIRDYDLAHPLLGRQGCLLAGALEPEPEPGPGLELEVSRHLAKDWNYS